MRKTARNTILALLATAAILAAGCSDDGGDDATDDEPTTSVVDAGDAATSTTPGDTATSGDTAPDPSDGSDGSAGTDTDGSAGLDTGTDTGGESLPTDPGSYAAAFLDTWRNGDMDRARTFATTTAIDVMFAYEAGGGEDAPVPEWTLESCEHSGDITLCTFGTRRDPKIIITVDSQRAGRGEPQAVTDVRVES